MSNNTKNNMHAPGKAYDLLNQFAGKWKTEGRIYINPFMPEGFISGTDEYEWMAGGFFLVHHVNVKMGEGIAKSIEIIGYNENTGTYPMHSFDNQGNHTIMEAKHSNRKWIFSGEGIRFTGSFSENLNELNGIWEYLDEKSKWAHWMDLILTKL